MAKDDALKISFTWKGIYIGLGLYDWQLSLKIILTSMIKKVLKSLQHRFSLKYMSQSDERKNCLGTRLCVRANC